MKSKILLLALLISIKGYAQNDTTYIKNYDLYGVGKHKDGEKTGHWTYFYKDFSKKSEGEYKDGQVSGIWTNWYPNGNMEDQVSYESGVLIGIDKMYHENGEAFNCNDFFIDGTDLMELMLYKESSVFLKKATDLCPDSTILWIVSAVNKQYLGDYDGAIADLNQSLKIDPDNSQTLFRRSQAYFEDGQDAKALDDINRSIEIDPNHAKSYLLKGMIFYNTKQYDKAVSTYNTLINLDTKEENWRLRAMKFKAEVSLEIKNYKQAVDTYNLYLKKESTDVEGIIGRAKAFMLMDKKRKACKDWHSAVKLNSEFAAMEMFKDVCK